MSQARRRELKFQDHILDSYKRHGGTGRKWATDLQAGMPDLILTLQGVGLHLAEVKHRPEFGKGLVTILNPLTKLQRSVAEEFKNNGALVFGLLVGGGEATANDSVLYIFDADSLAIRADLAVSVPYSARDKYDVRTLLNNHLGSRTKA